MRSWVSDIFVWKASRPLPTIHEDDEGGSGAKRIITEGSDAPPIKVRKETHRENRNTAHERMPGVFILLYQNDQLKSWYEI
jgi:hypothetical protein